MSDSVERSLLRGSEELIFDHVWKGATDEQVREWLRIPLETAAGAGDLDLVEKLTLAGAKGDALHLAIRGGHTDMVCDMLMVGQSAHDKDDHGNAPLHIAAALGYDDIVRLLLLKGAVPHATDASNYEPLHLAVKCGHLSTAKALLVGGADAKGCNPHVIDPPLHMAATAGDENIMRTLIQHGANVDATASTGSTALHTAAALNTTGAIDVLVESAADLGAREWEEGSTPLAHAVSALNYEAALSLLQYGADVGEVDNLGNTPLHLAATNAGTKGCTEVVDLLLKWGASETELDCKSRTPAEVVGLYSFAMCHSARDDAEHVQRLLGNAAADRLWRRRGLPILCRTFPDRVLLDPRRGGQAEKKAWMVPAVAKVRKMDMRAHKHLLYFGEHPRADEIGRGYDDDDDDDEDFGSSDSEAGGGGGAEGGGGGAAAGGGREEIRGGAGEGAGEFNSLTASLLLKLDKDDVFRNIVGFL